MGKYSDDPAVDGAVAAAEADYVAAQELVRDAPEDADIKAAYDEAKTDFFNARQAARGDRPGLGITAEGE